MGWKTTIGIVTGLVVVAVIGIIAAVTATKGSVGSSTKFHNSPKKDDVSKSSSSEENDLIQADIVVPADLGIPMDNPVADVCAEAPFFPVPQIGRASIPRFSFNPASGKCESFVYGGHGGNGNNFEDEEACRRACPGNSKPPEEKLKKDVCTEAPFSPVPQIGRASIPRFSFNPASEKCESFVYGGHGGNGNNFENEDACRRACPGKSKPPEEELKRDETVPDPCKEEPYAPDPQVCRASKRRYSYDPLMKECKIFVYGGCKGNSNNFESEEECKKACIPPQ